jgi:hypothetical protein
VLVRDEREWESSRFSVEALDNAIRTHDSGKDEYVVANADLTVGAWVAEEGA